METEVKLAFKDKESLFKCASAESFRKFHDGSSPCEKLLENSYIDTEDMTLIRRGGALRIRHVVGKNSDSYEFTVKCGGGSSEGLHRRYEWNVQSATNDFSIESFKKACSALEDPDPVELLEAFFEGINDQDLKVLCSNSFYRTKYILMTDRSTVEACFDSGIIKSDNGLRTDEICELELELLSGDVSDLEMIRNEIVNGNDCSPFDKTKFRRTLDMIDRG